MKLALTIPEVCEAANSGRTGVYAAIRDGQLRAVKRGRRTFVLPDDLRRWIDALPALDPRA